MGFVADMKSKQTLKLIIIIFSFLGIKAKESFSFPQTILYIPLIIFVTSLNLLQFYHICTWQAWVLSVPQTSPNSILQNICWHLRPSIELILLLNSSGIGHSLAGLVAFQNKTKPVKTQSKQTNNLQRRGILRWGPTQEWQPSLVTSVMGCFLVWFLRFLGPGLGMAEQWRVLWVMRPSGRLDNFGLNPKSSFSFLGQAREAWELSPACDLYNYNSNHC